MLVYWIRNFQRFRSLSQQTLTLTKNVIYEVPTERKDVWSWAWLCFPVTIIWRIGPLHREKSLSSEGEAKQERQKCLILSIRRKWCRQKSQARKSCLLHLSFGSSADIFPSWWRFSKRQKIAHPRLAGRSTSEDSNVSYRRKFPSEKKFLYPASAI